MPRSLVLGNGSTLVCLDGSAQVRDFYYDYVGLENHMNPDSSHKIGVYINNSISWLDDGSWEINIDYLNDSLVSEITAKNPGLEIELHLKDFVYNERNIFVRQITLHNLSKEKRQIKLYLNHQFTMYGTERGDTAYYDPGDGTIVHYKGRRVAVIGGLCCDCGFDEYSIGLARIEGKVGSWKDAEDGKLSGNAIEHGSVDSTIGFAHTVDAHESYTMYSWVSIGKTLEEAKELYHYVLGKTPEHILESTTDFWHAWSNKMGFTFFGLDEPVVRLFKKSLLIMRAHFDNTGAVIASGDSGMLQYGRDTYGYVWPRDAAFITLAMDKAGYSEVAEKFFDFATATISPVGYFFHKYRCDKSLGSSWHPWYEEGYDDHLPIQEDETALVVYALWEHYKFSKDLEFVENNYNKLIKSAADFMLNFRDKKTMLPKPSYDLWEMKYGVSTFTAASVYGALNAAARFAQLLGKEKDEDKYKNAAEEIKQAILTHLYFPQQNYFYKLIENKDGKILHDKTIDISSFYGLVLFDVLDINDDKITKALNVVQEKLVNKNEVGGVIRFEGDIYHQIAPDTSNPWFVTTLWLAKYYIKIAKKPEQLEPVKDLLSWVTKYATPSGMLSEQLHPYSGQPLSACPLAWSHSEFVTTLVDYLNKLEEFGVCVACNPVK